VRGRRWIGRLVAAGVPLTLLGAAGLAAAAGGSDLQQTAPLVEVMFLLSVAGAVVTFFVLVWALAKFRDPATKGRRYG
jgi:hypothetical protein